jgi:hypothetical protein
MSNRKIVLVLPSNGNWKVKTQGAEKAYRIVENKLEAIKIASGIAKNAELGQVKIWKENGKIEKEYTYGKDPEKIKG